MIVAPAQESVLPVRPAGVRLIAVAVVLWWTAATAGPDAGGGSVSRIEQLKRKGRAEIISAAKVEAKKALANFPVDEYSRIDVYGRAGQLKVVFAYPMLGGGPASDGSKARQFQVLLTETGALVDPAAKHLFVPTPMTRKVCELFAGESGTVHVQAETAEQLEVTFTRESRGGMSGGAEQYFIDKKTWAKTMGWHESPQPRSVGTLSREPNAEDFEEL